MIPARCCSTSLPRASLLTASVFAGALLAGCGGGFHANSTTPPSSTAPVSVQVSGDASPLSATCGTTTPTSDPTETFTLGSGIQPQVAVIPGGAVVGVWEQDRWSGVGTRGIMSAHSTDSGATWSTPTPLPFSNCGGGAGAGSTYDRASDPWISFAGGGVVYASALAFSANAFTAAGLFGNGPSAVLVSRSTDSGASWSAPVAVWTDANSGSGTLYFNDRDSVTADPASGNVYVVWDRLNSTGAGSIPAYLALSKNGGVSWNSGVLYDPGAGNQAFNNEIVILPSGTVLDFFTLVSNATYTLQLVSLTFSSTGWTASSPVTVATMQSNGTQNPIPSGTPIRDSSRLAQVAVDSASGAVAAVWQQAFNNNTVFDGIALSVSTNGGSTWSAPIQVNGSPTVAAFSPTVRYLPGGVLAVTYYDLRSYMSGSSVLSTSAWLTESSDGGKTWHELQLQNPFDLTKAPVTNNTTGFGGSALFLGDNQGLALVGSNALPFYSATTSGAHIVATRGADPLTSSSAHTYTASALGRPSAAVAAKARANVERIRERGLAAAGQP
jgi:hypothetical protein